MGSQKTFHLRDLALLILAFLFVLGVGYKYFEWNTLKNLISVSNKALKDELLETEKTNSFYNSEGQPLIAKIFSEKVLSNTEYIDLVDKLRNKLTISEDMDKEYSNLLKVDKQEISRFEFNRLFLIGNSRKFVIGFVENSLGSYDESIKYSSISSIDTKFLNDFFMVSRDMAVSNEFYKNAPPYYNEALVQFVQKNYYKAGVLEKYTKDDFKFSDEENYKNNNPYGYEILTKYKDYLKSFYLIVKDLAANDIESATYKYSKFQNQSVAINVDFEKLFGEGQKKKNEVVQSNLNLQAKIVRVSKEFDMNGIKEYPVLGKVGKFNSDLALCALYVTKGDLYKNITSDYPISTDSKSFVTELSKIGPNTEFVDNLFDYEILKIVSNDKTSIKYECLDRDAGKTYKFETVK